MSQISSSQQYAPGAPTPIHTFRDGRRVPIRWSYAIIIGIMHVLCFAAIPFFSWSGTLVMFLFLWITGGIGITLGYHRLLTHRSFHTPRIIEYLITLCGCLAWQGSPITWVGTHRIHHKESDKPGDPHSPTEGFGWAHVLWVIFEPHPGLDPSKAAQDLARDPVHRFIHHIWMLPQILLLGAVFGLGWAYGGWYYALSWAVYGVILRVVLMYHGTWFVNSASHMWGYRNFETTDQSRNNWWVALFSFGEGWHNNHHAQQRSAAHGMKWWEFDMTYWTIRAMELVGLAKRVVRPKLPESP